MTNLTDADLAAMKARAEDGKLHAAIVYLRDVRSLLAEVAALHKQVELADKVPHDRSCRWDRIDALAYRGPLANCTCWKAEYDAAKRDA